MNRAGKIRTVLVIGISFFMPLFLAYSHNCALSEADFLSPGLQFENTDQENSCLVDHHKSELADSSGYTTAILPQMDLFDQTLYSCTQSRLNDQKALVLRC